ncbi:MAG: hypothetical protein FWC50_13070 [Planctomycetaceae bacterium]|nr:hypothetical protein [Planctomycetaceae bacterium]
MNELLTSVSLKIPLWATSNQMSSIMQNMGQQFSATNANESRSGEMGVLLLAMIAVLGVLGACYYFFVGKRDSSSGDDDRALFRKLCQIHQLRNIERKILKKISKALRLDTTLPIFIEPKFFEQSLTYESLESHHSMIRKIFNKLFERPLKNTSIFQSQEKTANVSETNQQVRMKTGPSETSSVKTAKEAILSGIYDTSVSNLHGVSSETDETTIPNDHKNVDDVDMNIDSEKQKSEGQESETALPFRVTPRRTVTYPSVPGASVLTSLVATVNELSNEIAATSIRHTLSDGNELNQRTFNAAPDQADFECNGDQTPAFPKSSVPTPEEMLFLDPQHRNFGKASPTPRFLQTNVRKISPPGRVLARKTEIENVRANFSQKPNTGETLTMEDVVLLEKMVREKTQ